MTSITKRIIAVKTTDAINAIEGAEISDYAKILSKNWALGRLTDTQMKQSLLSYHKKIAVQEHYNNV